MTYEMLNSTIFTAFVNWPLSPLFVVVLVDILFVGFMIYMENNLYEMIIEKKQVYTPLFYILIIVIFGIIIIIINMAVFANIYDYICTDIELKFME